MFLNIVTIGNSQGVRLPKPLLDQFGFSKRVEVEVRGEELVLKKVKSPREGWQQSFLSSTQDMDADWLNMPSEGWEE